MDALLVRAKEEGNAPRGYDPLTGRVDGRYTIPDKGEYLYQTTIGTVGFLKQILGRRFACVREERLPDGLFWLVFEKAERSPRRPIRGGG